MSNVPRHVWVVDPQPDHAALQREALELAFPHLRVETFAALPNRDAESPDLIVIDQESHGVERLASESMPGAAQPVIWLTHEERSANELRGLVLDKRNSGMFFDTLVAAVGRALDGSSVSTVATQPSMQPDSNGGPAQTAAVASLLSEARHSLEDLQRINQLLAQRFSAQMMEARLASAQSAVLHRTTGVLLRLERLLDRPQRARFETLPLDTWLALRSSTWSVLLGASAPSLTIDVDTGPWVRFMPAAIGNLLDELLTWFAHKGTLAPEVRTSCSYIDQSYVELHQGASLGCYARLEVRSSSWSETSDLPEALANTAVALARAHGGYAEIAAERVVLLLPQVPQKKGSTSPTVLLVDSGCNWLSEFSAALRGLGIEVAICASNAAAEALLSAGCRYDLVLFDQDHPKQGEGSAPDSQHPDAGSQSAVASMRRLMTADPMARCLCLTPNLSPSALHEMMAAGMYGYCPKTLAPRLVSSWLHPMLVPLR